MIPTAIGAEIMRLVLVDPIARRTFPWLPAAAPRGSRHTGPAGELVEVLSDGSARLTTNRCNEETP